MDSPYFSVALIIIMISLFLALIRFAKGPTRADRIAAFDSIAVIMMGLIVLIACNDNNGFYLDVALIYALLGFTGVLVFARYIEKQED